METTLQFVPYVVGAVVVGGATLSCYVKAPPSIALIISGLSSKPRVLSGKGGFRVPFLERIDHLYLGQMSVDIKTAIAVPTKDFINVMVDAVVKVRVHPEHVTLAAKNFLNMDSNRIASELQDSLEGNLREIIGTLDLTSLNIDRDGFSDAIQQKASVDMLALGIEILSCNIQNVSDQAGLIKDLGADNTFKIKKDAAITKANAERDMAVAQSEASKQANDARVKAETDMAKKNTELAIIEADLKRQADIKKAEADAAYRIQEQTQQRELNTTTVDAEIERAKKEQELSEERIKVKQNILAAEVNAKADADKYQTEVDAAAKLEQLKRQAEAEKYKKEQEAEALKIKAEADRFAMEQNALGIKADGEAKAYAIEVTGSAEAKAIEAKGKAEAEAMEKKAEAYAKYNQAAIIEMTLDKLPSVAAAVAAPISAIKDVHIYGSDGSGVAEMSGNVPTLVKQSFDLMQSATGVDMGSIVRANSLEAKTDRNFKIDVPAIEAIEVGKPVAKSNK